MSRRPTESIVSRATAKEAIANLPTEWPYVYHGKSFTLRRAYRSQGSWGTAFDPKAPQYVLTGGAVLVLHVNYSTASVQIEERLRPGWDAITLSRALVRASRKGHKQARLAYLIDLAERTFGRDRSDEDIAAAEAFAASIGWDGVYGSGRKFGAGNMTVEHAVQFIKWCDKRFGTTVAADNWLLE